MNPGILSASHKLFATLGRATLRTGIFYRDALWKMLELRGDLELFRFQEVDERSNFDTFNKKDKNF